MRVSLSTRIWALAVGGALLAAATGGAGLWGKVRLVSALQDVQTTATAISNHMACDMMHDALRGDVLAVMLARTPGEVAGAQADLEDHAATFQKSLEANKQLGLGNEVQKALHDLVPSLEEYTKAAEHIAQTAATDREAGRSELPSFLDAFKALEEKMESLSELLETSAAEASESAAEASHRIMVVMAAVVGVGVAALAAWTWFIRRGIVRPLRRCVMAMEQVASGDLTAQVGLDSTDEIGRLGQSADSMIGSLRTLVGDVAGTAREVAAAATEISASSEEMAAGMQRQETQSNLIAEAVRDLASSVTQVAQMSDQATAVAGRSREQAGNGDKVVRQTVDEMRHISTEVNESAAAVADLGKKSEQIGRIIGVISDIADQTNLLALNAAIEAARAGDHGRGFAVVADEVRKLAERTMKATSEVATSIREVQEGTTSSVGKIQRGSLRAGAGVKLANDAGASLAQIIEESDKVRETVAGIAEATRSQAQSSQQVAAGVEQIRSVLRESNAGAAQSAEAAGSLSRHSERLQDLVGRFRLTK
jgi:methyl-accepting chemotaxis protein